MYRLQSDVLYFCLIKTLLKLNMIVFVNDTPVRTYYGAKVKSAVMAYFRDNDIPVKTIVKEVRDAYGNLIDMDGSIRANSKIYIKI